MSLSYGNFSHVLSSTVESGIIKSGTLCYFTLPWYPASYVERIKVEVLSGTAPNTYTQLAILGNGAHERIGDFTSVDSFLHIDTTSTPASATGNSFGGWNINNPVYVDNKYSRPYLHVKLTFDTCNVAKFRLTAQGRKSISSSYLHGDITGIKKLKDYRVLKSGNGGTVDVTSQALFNSSNGGSSFNISSSTDFIIVGSETRVDHWDFGVAIGSTDAVTMVGQLWDGSAWKSFTVLDNTGAGSTQPFRYSGVVEGYGIGTSTWLPTTLPTDPLTIYQNDITAGNTKPIGFFYNPPRFWARFSATSLSDTVHFKYVLPVEDVY